MRYDQTYRQDFHKEEEFQIDRTKTMGQRENLQIEDGQVGKKYDRILSEYEELKEKVAEERKLSKK